MSPRVLQALPGAAWLLPGRHRVQAAELLPAPVSLNTTANLPYGGAVAYTITGTVIAPATSQLSNTASLVIPGSVTDYNPNDTKHNGNRPRKQPFDLL